MAKISVLGLLLYILPFSSRCIVTIDTLLLYKIYYSLYCIVTVGGAKMVIKSVLKEELANSLRMKKRYERELAKLPKGSLVKRNIKGHEYYYLVYRENGKFMSVYKGKSVRDKELKKYKEAKNLRSKYRKALSQLKKQIRYLEGVLRGKEEI